MSGLNTDCANVSVGVHREVGTQLIKKALWLQVIHCFNNRVELAFKDVFTTIHFKNIEEMLVKLYYLYQRNPKHLRELQGLSEACDMSLPKPTKCNGTRWIDHKYRALKVL